MTGKFVEKLGEASRDVCVHADIRLNRISWTRCYLYCAHCGLRDGQIPLTWEALFWREREPMDV